MTDPRPFLAGGCPVKSNKNANQPNLIPHANQLINVSQLRSKQIQTAGPVLVQILTQIQ